MRRNGVNTEKSLKDCLAHKRHFVIAVSGYYDGQGPTYTSRQLEVGGGADRPSVRARVARLCLLWGLSLRRQPPLAMGYSR